MNQEYSLRMDVPVSELSVESRATFISRTYLHLLGAIIGFTLIEVFLFTTGLAYSMAFAMLSVNWLLILGAFVIVSWMASSVAHSSASSGVQYAALTGFVIAEAVIFVPLLVIADLHAPGAIQSAAVVTAFGFAGLTLVVFMTRKDFSFLKGILWWGFIAALVLIVSAVLFGFELGTYFSVAMITLAGGAILYKTSNVLHHYPEDRYVAAALELFASVALLFWYVLRLFLSRR
jgi:uncharacterized protein